MGNRALRGIGADWLSPNYMKHMHANLATRYLPEDNYVANLMGALAQIDAGCTTLVDWCHNITTMEHAERAVDGLVDSGIRAVFAHGTAEAADQAGRQAVPRGAASARPHRKAAQGTALLERRASSRSRWRSSGPTGEAGRSSSTTSAWRANSVWCRRRIRGDARTASSRTATRRMLKAGCCWGQIITLCMAPATMITTCESLLIQGASLTSTVLVELHHHIGDTAEWRAYANTACCRRSASTWNRSAPAKCSGKCRPHFYSRAARKFATILRVATSPYQIMPVKSREALQWTTIGGARAC